MSMHVQRMSERMLYVCV